MNRGKEVLLGTGIAILLTPAALSDASPAATSSESPNLDAPAYPKNVIGYNQYGFHNELPDKELTPSGSPEMAEEENCVELVLNSLRRLSYKTSKDLKKVKAGIKLDSVAECSSFTDRTVDVHFDMERWAPRDTTDSNGKPIKEIGLDPNSNVKVFESEASVNSNTMMKLNHKYQPTISGEKRNFQMVVGINAKNKTNQVYRKSYVLPLINRK